MTRMTIHSQRHDFQLLACIERAAPASIAAMAQFDGVPCYLGLEALAQLGALHTRSQMEFSRHAFLLKVARWEWAGLENLEGRFALHAHVQGQSDRVVAYRATASGPNQEAFTAEFLIGIQDYDGAFRKNNLQNLYQNRFRHLLR